MTIWLGLQLDAENHLPRSHRSAANEKHFTPRAFVQWLEAYYGLQHPAGNIDYLRGEQYRQLCAHYLAQNPTAFFAASFGADSRAAAEELLSRRDELISAGYALHRAPASAPPRILALAAIEALALDPDLPLGLRPGFADRIHRLVLALPAGHHPQLDIRLHEPEEWLPPGLRRLLSALRAGGTSVEAISIPGLTTEASASDLRIFQDRLVRGGRSKLRARADGSLLILRAIRETHLASYLARLLREQPSWRPALLMPEKKQTLNNAFTLEGLPDLGLAVNSLARPSLQVLKLVTSFLWEPADTRKIIEFLNLTVKPFDHHFARRLAASLAESPGLHGPDWARTVARYFQETLPRRAEYDRGLDVDTVREQYEFWFNRRRYPQDAAVPKSDVRALFTFLLNWCREEQPDLGGADLSGRQALGAQCRRLIDLIDTLPEGDLRYLETERLVRTVYEPSPTAFQEAESGHLPFACAPAAIYGPVDELIWWDFTQRDPDHFFSRWTTQEIAHLESEALPPLSPKAKNDRLAWQQLRPFLHARRRIILCLSDFVDGQATQPHPLIGDLEAAFGDSLAAITIDVDAADKIPPGPLDKLGRPVYYPQPIVPLAAPSPGISLTVKTDRLRREYETHTSLQQLVYYPHQYALRYGLGLRTNDILSVAGGNRLLGNLGHRVIEDLLSNKGDDHWGRDEVFRFVNDYLPTLLAHEGAPLLEYGSEPERVQFRLTIGQACWALTKLIQENHWEVLGTEIDLEGEFGGLGFRGRADLLLKRADELAIIDLKWRGKTAFTDQIKNREDLQLALYADLVADQYKMVHTAYFIIKDGIMIARNEGAFAGIGGVSPEEDALHTRRDILNRLRQTHDWRRRQLAEGWLETRCELTAGELEDRYQRDFDLIDLLEMKTKDARWDDYRRLIGLLS